jgi:hypothetical protein
VKENPPSSPAQHPGQKTRGPATLAYWGSDPNQTKRVLRALEDQGQRGQIAAHLFRAQKASARASEYRDRSGRGPYYAKLAYRRKGEALNALCNTLDEDAAGLIWGWGTDARENFAPHVLYVELPTGQVSFHSPERFNGPDFPGVWDGVRGASEGRILQLCNQLLEDRPIDPPASKLPKARSDRSRRSSAKKSRSDLTTRSAGQSVGSSSRS